MLALAEEEEAHGFYRLLAATGDLDRRKGMIVGETVEEPEKRRDTVLHALVESEHAPRDLGADVAGVVAVGELEVASEEAQEREIGCGLAVGGRARLEDEPACRAMGADELVEEPRLPYSGLAHYRHDLAAARPRLLEGAAELLELGVAPHEARQPTGHRGMEPRTC